MRRLQFSIRALLLAMAVVAVGCAIWNSHRRDRDLLGIEPKYGIRIRTRLRDGRLQTLFDPAPKRLHSLLEAPNEREAELESGCWLVMAYAFWSADDCFCLRDVIRFAHETTEPIRVAVRPFNNYEEMGSWCPDFFTHQRGEAPPYWVMLRDGETIATHAGLMDDAQIAAFVRRAVATGAEP